jgi:hypothetical protein
MNVELPKGILKSDLKRPEYGAQQDVPWEARSFELWYTTGMGWVIPTLDIAKAKAGMPRRTYAVRVVDGSVCRVGQGPHVTQTLVVYVTSKRYQALEPFLLLRTKGRGDAGAVRDRISSRRAQGQVERALGKTSWRWK